MNIEKLSRLSQQYYLSGLSPSTRKAYQVGFHAYKAFCANTNRQEIPTSEATLLLFVTYLADQRCSSSTIKVYLAAIRNAHEAQGEHECFMEASTPPPTTSDERDTKRTGYCDMSQDTQAYHHIHHVTNTANTVKGSITPQLNDMGCLLHSLVCISAV